MARNRLFSISALNLAPKCPELWIWSLNLPLTNATEQNAFEKSIDFLNGPKNIIAF